MHFEQIQINLLKNAGGKMNMELRQREVVALSGRSDDRTGGSGCFDLLNLWVKCGKKRCHLFYWYLLGGTHCMLLHMYAYVHVRFFRALDEFLLHSI